MRQVHILIVEDEEKLAELLRDYLVSSGYRVSCFNRGDLVVPFVRQQQPDLVLLDLMLPGMDGAEICRRVRQFSTLPILMITAKVEEIDRIVGLELGADDYICKPFSPREVVARVKAVLRRVYPETTLPRQTAGPLTMDASLHEVTADGRSLSLTPSEFGLLRVLIQHPNRVFTRSELLEKVQGYQFEGYDRTIDTHIKNLRRKIAEQLPDRELIQSVYGVGYKLVVPGLPKSAQDVK